MINSNEIKNKVQNSNSIDKNKQEEEIGNREYQLCIQKALNEALNENELLKEEINKLNKENLKLKNELNEKDNAILELANYYEYCQNHHMNNNSNKSGESLKNTRKSSL